MRNLSTPILSLLMLGMCSLVFTSCKDDEPFVKPKLSFKAATLTVNEDDDVIEVEVVLDKPAAEDFTIDYSLDGTAVDKVTAGTTQSYDYEILGDYLEINIAKGETSGTIQIQLYSDLDLEDPEEIKIHLETVDSDKIEITRDDDMKITLEQENGMAVVLEWGVGEGEVYTDVDMDLFLWAQNDLGELVLTSLGSANASFTSPEFLFLPNILDDGTYGLSYNYYAGTKNPMNFKVTFAEFINGSFEAVANRNIFNQSYTLENVNPWDVTKNDPLLSQQYKKTGAVYSDFTAITVPATGSRTRSNNQLPLSVKRSTKTDSPHILKFLQQ